MNRRATLALASPALPDGRSCAEELFLRHLPLIERVASFVSRSSRMAEADVEDFVGWVKLALIEDDYAIVRKFEGRSSFPTYLTTVIHRLLSQHRSREWGRWRPSAEAKRLGGLAITLERLRTRDGHSLTEAVQILTTGAPPAASRAEVEALALRLPLRQPRIVLVPEEPSACSIPCEDDPADGARNRDRRTMARTAAQTLDRAVAAFEPEDQLILRQRFWHGRSVADIAHALHLHQKKTYRRFDKLLARLRRDLETAGVGRSEVDDLILSGAHPVDIPTLSAG